MKVYPSIAALATFLTAPAFGAPSTQSSIPEAVYTCLPKLAEKKELEAVHTKGEKTYYLFLASGPGNQYSEPLIVLEKDSCTLLSKGEKFTNKRSTPPSRFVSMDVAQQLALQKFQKSIQQAGGNKKFQQGLLQDDEDPEFPPYWDPEDVWALKKLGFRLPSNYKINR
jgi:hypothetical protein